MSLIAQNFESILIVLLRRTFVDKQISVISAYYKHNEYAQKRAPHDGITENHS